MNTEIKGILFDFNGTMFFDEKFQETAWRTFIQEKTGRSVSDEEFQKYVHGINAEITLPYFWKRSLSRQEVAALEEEKEVVYRRLCLENPQDFCLADGLKEFLDELLRKEISLTIATASAFNNVKFFFEHLGLDKWFSLEKVVYNDGTIPGKPQPDIYWKAAEKIGVDIADCMVFEDAKPGIEAAKRAGAGRIGGVASMLEEDVLLSCGADIAVKNYCDTAPLWALIGRRA